MIGTAGEPTDWQGETIKAFVIPQKRDRYAEAVSNAKQRKKFVASLSHFDDFDSRWIIRVEPSSQHAATLHAILVTHGAPPTCWAISESTDLDGKEVELKTALERTVGYQMGTVLSCIPGRLAYFENEDVRFILRRDR